MAQNTHSARKGRHSTSSCTSNTHQTHLAFGNLQGGPRDGSQSDLGSTDDSSDTILCREHVGCDEDATFIPSHTTSCNLEDELSLEVARETCREINGLRRGICRPGRFDPTPAKRKRTITIETYESCPCSTCGIVDANEGLVCESCDKLVHLSCMKPALTCVPDGDWHCHECREQFDFTTFGVQTPCTLCGVADDKDGLVCDRCDAVYHHECLGDTVAACNAKKWFCSSCHDEAHRDMQLSSFTSRLWEGLDGQTGAASPCVKDSLSANDGPSIMAWLKDGEFQLRYALYLPAVDPDQVFEVVHAASTPLFQRSSACIRRNVFLLTGIQMGIPPLHLCALDTPLMVAHVGYNRDWSIPEGCSAIVPMAIDVESMSLIDLPKKILDVISTDNCAQQCPLVDSAGMDVCELYSGLGCWLDGARRSGKLKFGMAVESDREVAQVSKDYLQGCAEIVNEKVEALVGAEGHFCRKGSAAQKALELMSKSKLDCIAGSPLCEGFSNMNRHHCSHRSMEKRGHLRHWGQAVLKFTPTYALMENVPEVTAGRNEEHLCTLLALLAMAGYQLQTYLLSCSAFGAASTRTRFVLVATRTGLPVPPSPRPTHRCFSVGRPECSGVRWALAKGKPSAYDGHADDLLPPVTLRRVLCDLGSPTAPPRDASLPGDLHAERTEHENVRALLDALPIDENACYANIRAKIRRKYPISRAESDMSSGADKFAQLIFRRLSPDRPASSFTTQFRPDGFQGRVVHPNEARVCTPAEALSCLGFEVSSLPHAKLSVGHRLAGNAFSPLVTKAIFDAICTPLKDR